MAFDLDHPIDGMTLVGLDHSDTTFVTLDRSDMTSAVPGCPGMT